LELNGEPLNIHMKLGESGEAFFVEEVPENEVESSAHLATSPIPDNGFSLYQEQILPPRRTSSTDFTLDKYQNQVSDYTQRRYTDGENSKPNMSAQKREYQMLNNDFMYDYKPTQSSHEQEMFVMDDLQDQNGSDKMTVNTPLTVKTFCAEEVNDKESRAKDVVRKISMNNDFRPISIAKSEALNLPSDGKPIEEASVPSTMEETQKAGNNNKKKKKTKKSGSKKKNSVPRKLSSSSNGYSSQSETMGSEAVENEKSDEKDSIGMADKELIQNTSFKMNDMIQDHFFSDTDILSSAPRFFIFK
jgi:phosphatidate phosphatase LPIN